ncbi:MAG: VWA domain-containing protein [Deltaproteobacteria bacterium]|nr:VWA domain-containing protein [Deltaproteobacteria bacterium]
MARRVAETQQNRKKSRSPTALYPWLRRDYFKTSVSYLVSLGVHALIFLFFLATVVLEGGGGPGDSMGGKGDAFSTLVGHGMLDEQTQRTDESKSLQEEIAKAVEQVQPLPEVESETTPDLSDFGVRLTEVAPRINPMPNASALRNMPAPSTGGGMALGPGLGAGGGVGGGIGRGFGRGFGDFIGLLEKTGFDVVFLIDATDSMGFVIDTVKAQLANLVDTIRKLVPNARVGLVLYKDRGEDFVVRKSDLTFHLDKLRSFIGNIQAGGGGDYEEAVMDGMKAAVQQIKWRKYARRVIVLVPSSQAHAPERQQTEDFVRAFHQAGGILHVLDLADIMHRNYEIEFHTRMYGKPPEQISPLPSFLKELEAYNTNLAKLGGGEILPLGAGDKITEQLMIAAFGPKWRKEVEKFAAGG